MMPKLTASQTIALMAAAVSLTCACGIGYHAPPQPPPPEAGYNIEVSDKPLLFKVKVNTVSSPKVVTLTNRSTQAIEIKQITLDQHALNPFAMDSHCGASIAPAASCTLRVTFAPTAATHSETLLTMKFAYGELHIIYVAGDARKH